MAVSVIDLQLLRIPDRVTFPTLAVAVPLVALVSLRYDDGERVHRGAGRRAASTSSLLLLPHLVYPRGMGFGDVKLALRHGALPRLAGMVGQPPAGADPSSSSCTP